MDSAETEISCLAILRSIAPRTTSMVNTTLFDNTLLKPTVETPLHILADNLSLLVVLYNIFSSGWRISLHCLTGLDARAELSPNGNGNPLKSRKALKMDSTNNDSFDNDPASGDTIEFSIGSVPDDIS